MMSIYIAVLFLFLLTTIINIITIPTFSKKTNKFELNSKVSILVPLRNEEKNAKELVQSLKELTYPNLEFFLLDDHSTDRTKEYLLKAIERDERFQIVEGSNLPENWVGKVYGCHQLSKLASGDYFLFIDADVRLKQNTIEKALHMMKRYKSGLVTGFAKSPINPFLGKLLVPMQHFLVYFHLPNFIANQTTLPAFTAAHGAFMFFNRNAYESIGGHASVANSLLEDVHIARKMKQNGFRVTLTNLASHVTVHMYDTNREVWSGFTKNIFIGLNRSPIAVILVSAFYFSFYVMPLYFLVKGFLIGEWSLVLPYVIICVQTFIIDIATLQKLNRFFMIPLAAFAMIILLITSMQKGLTKRGFEWKGRIYQ